MVGSMTVPKAAAASLVVVVICALLGLNQLETAQGAIPEHLVSKLPGQPAVNFTQYAGYINVDKANGRNIFYWFTEADSKKASSLPIAFWFNGGKIIGKPTQLMRRPHTLLFENAGFDRNGSEFGKPRLQERKSLASHVPNLTCSCSDLVFVFKAGRPLFFLSGRIVILRSDPRRWFCNASYLHSVFFSF